MSNLEQMEIEMIYVLIDVQQQVVGKVLVIEPPSGSAFYSVELWAYDAIFSSGGTYTFTKSTSTYTGTYEQKRDAFRADMAAAFPSWKWAEASCTKPTSI
jgi:hypothetical protein